MEPAARTDVKCSGGPFHGRTISLTGDRNTLELVVGLRWCGRYVKGNWVASKPTPEQLGYRTLREE